MREDSGKAKIREATVAGIFYPEDPAELGEKVRSLLGRARPALSGARAILSPHAGFGYSGDLAALAWASAAGRKVERVLILSPLHRAEESLVYLPESGEFETPLGPVHVDRGLVQELLDCGTVFSMNDIPHLEEHGIELQLPFMRALFPDAALVPVILGKPSVPTVKALAAALGIVFGEFAEETLVVVSCDLASGDSAGAVDASSRAFLEAAARADWRSMIESPADRVADGPCGAACLAAFLASRLGAGLEARLLGRHDSAAARESRQERLVDYAAIAFRPAVEKVAR